MKAGSAHRSWLLLALTVAGMLGTGALGAWQLSRADQKQDLQAQLEQRQRMPGLAPTLLLRADPQWLNRSIALQGRWLQDKTVFLDNRPMQGRVGFYVLTPLQLDANAGVVLVLRGWVPRDAQDRTRLPQLPMADGIQQVEGRLAAQPPRLYELGAAGTGLIRQNLTPDDYARETGLPLLPWVVQQTGPQDELHLLRDWPVPAVDVHKHYGYAFQWFALSALQLGLYVWFQILRPRKLDRTTRADV